MKNPWKNNRPLFSAPATVAASKSKIRWRVLPILWMAIKRLCMALGAMVLISLIMGAIAANSVVNQAAPPLPDQMVLYLNLEDGLQELPREVSFADPFSAGNPTLRELVDALDSAAADERVKGLFARVNGGSFELAHVQELRAAIKRFRESGKFAYIYSSSYGESGNGLDAYYLASAFDEIWMQTMGVVSINGMSAEIPFMRSVLDEIGVYPNFFQRKEYKSAYESLTNHEMSAASREETEQLIADMRTEFLRDIPPERGMSALKFRQLVDKGLFTADEAVAAGLVTQASYADLLVDKITEQVTGDAESEDEVFVDIGAYAAEGPAVSHNPMAPEKPAVALVYVVGTIMPTSAGAGGTIAAADEIAPAIFEAIDDETIQAIVVRVDSPGGSPSASESILRAIQKAQAKGKTVIVSMGPVAASGGYWVSASADRIFVLPTTITGSIGVVGGKFTLGGLWEKLGVKWDGASWGQNAGMWSFNHPFTVSETERINAMLDQIYDGFVARVAKGRKMSEAEVDKIAGGRVWSGAQAIKVGLADEAGGLNEALEYTAKLLGAENKNGVEIVLMPRPKGALEQFLEMIGDQGSMIHILHQQKIIMEMLEPLAAQVSAAGISEPVMAYEPLSLK